MISHAKINGKDVLSIHVHVLFLRRSDNKIFRMAAWISDISFRIIDNYNSRYIMTFHFIQQDYHARPAVLDLGSE